VRRPWWSRKWSERVCGLWNSRKSRQRLIITARGEPRLGTDSPGADAQMDAEGRSALTNKLRRPIIDNQSWRCPDEKGPYLSLYISRRSASDAYISLVRSPWSTAVSLPVTLKIRTGVCAEQPATASQNLPESPSKLHSKPSQSMGPHPQSALYPRRRLRQHRRDQTSHGHTAYLPMAISDSPQESPCCAQAYRRGCRS